MGTRVKENYLMSWLELLGLDSVIMPSSGSFFIKLGTVVSPFPPFQVAEEGVVSQLLELIKFQFHVPTC
jgi:hypothetical protein